jgi:hypothetical protein
VVAEGRAQYREAPIFDEFIIKRLYLNVNVDRNINRNVNLNLNLNVNLPLSLSPASFLFLTLSGFVLMNIQSAYPVYHTTVQLSQQDNSGRV